MKTKPQYWALVLYGSVWRDGGAEVQSQMHGPFKTDDEVELRLYFSGTLFEATDTVCILKQSGKKLKDEFFLNVSGLEEVETELTKISQALVDKELPLIISDIKTPEGKIYLSQKLKEV